MSEINVVKWFEDQLGEESIKDITYLLESYLVAQKYLEVDYNEALKITKAIRQDICKMFATIRRIQWISEEKRNKESDNYEFLSHGIMTNRFVEFCGMDIEYFWIKYRSILEYSLDLLILFFPKLKNKKYKVEDKFKFLNDIFDDDEKFNKFILSSHWYDDIRKIRNRIIHAGATCVVFNNRKTDDILFQFYDLESNGLYYDNDYHKFNENIYYFEKVAIAFISYLYLFYEIFSVAVIAKMQNVGIEEAVNYIDDFPKEDYFGKSLEYINYREAKCIINMTKSYLRSYYDD